jgi:hypothetical protein
MSDLEWDSQDSSAWFNANCDTCGGSGWIPGIAHPVGPLDELPCPDCAKDDTHG